MILSLSLSIFVYLSFLRGSFAIANTVYYERIVTEREQVFHKKKSAQICVSVCVCMSIVHGGVYCMYAMQYALYRILQYFFLFSLIFFLLNFFELLLFQCFHFAATRNGLFSLFCVCVCVL